MVDADIAVNENVRHEGSGFRRSISCVKINEDARPRPPAAPMDRATLPSRAPIVGIEDWRSRCPNHVSI